jgi:hypothetical protein
MTIIAKGPRSYRAAGAVAAALLALGVSACNSSSKPSSSNVTVPSTVVPTTASGAATQSSTVCADIKATTTALESINFDSPSSIESHANTVASDVSKLDSDVSSSSYSPSGSYEQAMVQDAKLAIQEGQAAASQLSKGNAGNAENAFQQMKNDLQKARAAGMHANLSSCM